jgi:hypothetical protein
MEIKAIEELIIGDKIVIQTDIDKVEVHTVKKIFIDDGLVITDESYPMDLTVDIEYIPTLDDTF